MPLLFTGVLTLGANTFWGWRISMIIAGLSCMLVGVAYRFLTQDCPEGNYGPLRERGELPDARKQGGSIREAWADWRVRVLFLAYAACFGVELTFHNVAALYFADYFDLGLRSAGAAAAVFGLTVIFARTLGGWVSDRLAVRGGLRARTRWLFIALFAEGVLLVAFSRIQALVPALFVMGLFALFVHMACGATFALVPFVDRRNLGSVAGLVGAGGNVGAVAAGFLFKGALVWPSALAIVGLFVVASALLTLTVRFSDAAERDAAAEAGRLFAAAGLPEGA